MRDGSRIDGGRVTTDQPGAAAVRRVALLGLFIFGGIVGCEGGEGAASSASSASASASTSPPASSSGGAKVASDRFKLPDARRTFGSPGGGYELVISTPDGWASKRVAAALYRVDQAEGQGKRERLWERELPYKFGPRHAVVNDAGVVVLIDEWRNVKSDHAVRVIGPDGTVLADHPFEAVRAALEMEAGRLMDAVEGGGWWVAGTPRLSEEGNWMDVPAGGRFLRVRTADGALSAVDEREGKGGRE